MRCLFLLYFLLSYTSDLWAQNDLIKLNWITRRSFNPTLASFPVDEDKKAVVIFANEINTGQVDSTIRYESNKNTVKNIYIFCNKITFTGTLSFRLSGVFDTAGVKNPRRDGGNLVIYANTAEFPGPDVLRIQTAGEYNTYFEGIRYTSQEADTRFGGNPGSLTLIFDHLVINETRIISMAVDSLNATFDQFDLSESIDTSQDFNKKKESIINDLDFSADFFGESFDKAYGGLFSNKSLVAKQELKGLYSWQTFLPLYKKYVHDNLFDMMMVYMKESLKYSRDFNDLNRCERSRYKALFASGFFGMHWGESMPVVTENLFVKYQARAGMDFKLIDNRAYYVGPGTQPDKFHYYNNLNDFLNDNAGFETIVGDWIILMLTNVKVKLEVARRNSNYADFITAVNYYNSLPDVNLSDLRQLRDYGELLQQINTLKSTFNNRIIPLKNNILQEISNQEINYYVLPGFSLIKNYYADGGDKLGNIQVDLANKSITLNFSMYLIPDLIDEDFGQQMSLNNRGHYAGMYTDWTIDSYDLSYQGINKLKASFSKNGNVINGRLDINQDDKLLFAFLFGNGNIFLHMNCHSNKDPEFKFELNIPINFRFRFSNQVRLNNGQVTNNGAQDIVINGGIAKDGKFLRLDPTVIKSGQSVVLNQEIKSLPPEMIEQVLDLSFGKNIVYFENLTGKEDFFKGISITNNFPSRSDIGNYFQELQLVVQFFDGTGNKEYNLNFLLPRQQQVINTVYTLGQPKFTIKGQVIYENETVEIPETEIMSWNIILDGNLTHRK